MAQTETAITYRPTAEIRRRLTEFAEKTHRSIQGSISALLTSALDTYNARGDTMTNQTVTDSEAIRDDFYRALGELKIAVAELNAELAEHSAAVNQLVEQIREER